MSYFTVKDSQRAKIPKGRAVEVKVLNFSTPIAKSAVESYTLDLKRVNNAFNDLLPTSYVDRSFAEIFVLDDQQAIKEHISDLLNKKAQIKPLKNLQVNDINRILDIDMGKILDVSGDVFGFLVRVADLTQQKELEVNLSHSQRMQTIGHLVGSVAHDFNNLLTAIAGFCDLLLMRHNVGDPSFMHIMQIKQSV